MYPINSRQDHNQKLRKIEKNEEKKTFGRETEENKRKEEQCSTVLIEIYLEVLACNVNVKEKMYYELKKSSRVGRICVVIPADTTRRLSFFSFSKRVNISSSEASSSSLSSNNRFILSIRASSSL